MCGGLILSWSSLKDFAIIADRSNVDALSAQGGVYGMDVAYSQSTGFFKMYMISKGSCCNG